jgi:hypothetical protein
MLRPTTKEERMHSTRSRMDRWRGLRRRGYALVAVGLLLAGMLASQAAALGTTQAAAGGLPPYLADATDPAVTTLAADLGISIREAQRRIGWQEPAIQLGEELRRALGDRFGGLWFDEAGGGRVKVGVVAGHAADAGALIERHRLTAVTDLVPVRHSYDDLEAASAWLGTAAATANRGTAAGLGSAMLVDRNLVELRLPSGRSLNAAQRRVVDQARVRLGTTLALGRWGGRVARQACEWNDLHFHCDPPLRGGVTLRRLVQGDPRCSTAFLARSRVDGRRFMMTAGHCGGRGTVWHVYQPRTNVWHRLGAMHNQSTAGNDDYGIIGIDNVPGWNPRPYVYVHASPDTTLDPDYHINDDSTSPVGTRVCLSGARSGTDCGRVEAVNVGGAGGFAQVDYCSTGGDSGGSVYSDHRARGIHFGHVRGSPPCNNRLFQGVQEAENDLRVDVVHFS